MSAAKSGLQRLIQGTPIERPSRALWRRVHPPAPRTPNQLLNDVYDGLTYEIIRRILPRDGCAVDVGCHVGKVLEEILHAAPDGEHHAFEPLPHLAERLRHEFPSVAIHEVARPITRARRRSSTRSSTPRTAACIGVDIPARRLFRRSRSSSHGSTTFSRLANASTS